MKNITLKSAVALLLLFFLMLPQQGCKKESEEPPPPEPEIIVADHTRVISDEDWNANLVSLDTNDFTITFLEEISQKYDLQVNTIIVSSVGYGLLRKITGISSDNGNMVLTTQEAALSDAIVKGKLAFDVDISSPSMIKRIIYKSDGVHIIPGPRSGEGGFSIGIEEDFGTDYLTMEGVLALDDFTFSSYFDWHCGGWICSSPVLDTCNVSFGLKETLTLTGTLSKSIEVELKHTIFKAEYPTIIVMVGTVPVTITPVLTVVAGVDFSAQSSLSAGVIQTLEATGGVIYDGSGWDPGFGLEKSLNPIPPALSNTLEAKIYVKPQLALKIYQVFCPNVSVQPYGLLEAELGEDPWWHLYAGISADIGIKIDVVIAKLLDISYNLFDQQYELANSGNPGNHPPVAEFTVSPGTGTTETVFEFDASGSHDEEDPPEDLQVRWDWEDDGEWDTEFSFVKVAGHSYDNYGFVTARCQVKDSEEATNISTREVKVWDENMGKPCPGTPTVNDADGNVYNTVQIGDQCWMAENLNVGTMILLSEYPGDNGIIEKYCYENDINYCDEYGGLYNWQELMGWVETLGAKGICPEGWHLPTDGDWKVLEGVVDSQYDVGHPEWDKTGFRGTDAGFNLKSDNWWSYSGNGIDLFNLTILPGGRGSPTLSGDHCDGLGDNAYIWTSTKHPTEEHAFYRRFVSTNDASYRYDGTWKLGFAARCLKD